MVDDRSDFAPVAVREGQSQRTGLARMGLIRAVIMAVFLLAIGYAVNVDGDYGRVWTWEGYLAGVAALAVIARYRERLNWGVIGLGLGLGALVGLIGASGLSQGSTPWLAEATFTTLALIGGVLLRQTAHDRKRGHPGVRVSLLDGVWHEHWRVALRYGLRAAGRSLLFGALLGLPLAVLNVVYFAATSGPGQGWQLVLPQAVGALRPAVLEEIVFRFFLINLSVAVVGDRLSPRNLMIGALALGIFPHAFFHGAGGLVTNPLGYIGFSLLTGLIFGLPMAYLQWRRDLETAIGFHWVIDFVRFWAGY